MQPDTTILIIHLQLCNLQPIIAPFAPAPWM